VKREIANGCAIDDEANTYTALREGGDVLGSDDGRAGSNESNGVLHLDERL
jgi:hypothetical protein